MGSGRWRVRKGKNVHSGKAKLCSGVMFILGMTRENASGDQDGRSGWMYYVPAHRKLAEAAQLASKL